MVTAAAGKLAGRVALVTGGARGIGGAIAAAFAAEGAAVAVADRDGDGAEAAAARLRGGSATAVGMAADVTVPEQVEAMVARTVDELGGLHVLVANAGIDTVSPVAEMPLAQWQEMIDTNLTSVFLCARAAIPHMVEQRFGRIVNIGSQLASLGSTGMAHYCAAKAGVHGFTRALARELAPYGITVNAIAPGPVETDLLAKLPPDWLEAKKAELPIGRFARPEEIAPTAVLLASDDGAYYTGATMNVSGGDVM